MKQRWIGILALALCWWGLALQPAWAHKHAKLAAKTAKTVPTAANAAQASASLSTETDVQAPVRQRRLTLRDLGMGRPVTVRGVSGNASVGLGVRLDETVTRARLHLIFTLSPALLPDLSHLKILFNDEVIQTVLVDKTTRGTQQAADLDIDPRLFTDYNRLRVQLIGHYTMDCEMPDHSSLWASISNESYLDLQTQKLPLKTDLALLPAPFFDERDSSTVQLPLVFGAPPSIGLVRASGFVATWMGKLAAYRGTQFQVLENTLPTQNAVVLATNQNRPDFLKDLPAVNAPTLTLLRHPSLLGVKLLLLLGKDDAQVQQAAEILASGRSALSGTSMRLALLEPAQRRQAYDAPRWINTRRAVQLGELVTSPADLEVSGAVLNDVVRVNTRVPPDLFTWNARGVPMDLLYRYTPTNSADPGTLDLAINDQYIRSYGLSGGSGNASGNRNVLLPILSDNAVQARSDFKIPAFMVGGDNQLQFTFQIPLANGGRCQSGQPPELRAAIDPQSTVDFSGFYHYLAMPSLSAFANSGFPFTKYADLAETAFVLPNQRSSADIETYLTTLGRMGAVSGYAGTRFTVLSAAQWDQAKGHDIVVIAHADSDGLLARLGRDLPALIAQGKRSVRPLQLALGQVLDFFRIDAEQPPSADSGRAILEGQGALGAITGMESPLDAGRSVVVLAASDNNALHMVSAALNEPGKVRLIRGDLALMRGEFIDSFRINPVFYVGDLPWWWRLWFALHVHPSALAVVGVLCGLLFSYVIYSSLRALAKRRLNDSARK